MREESEPFVQRLDANVLEQRSALERIFRDGIRNAIVQAAVESSKLVCRDLRVTFKCQISYRLAKIPIVVNNLVNRESLLR